MAEWDVLVVGAGSNGLVLAGETAARGLRTLVLEARLEAGGSLATEECTLPGYWHNVRALFHNAFAETPPYQLLDLARENARFLVPPVQSVVLLRDGPPLVFGTDVAATCASLATYSMHDAQVYRDWYVGPERGLVERLVATVYGPPPAEGEGAWVLGALPEALRPYAARTPREVVADLFHSLEVRAALLQQLLVPWGIGPDAPGMGVAVFLLISGAAPLALALGGAHVLAQALLRALVRRGGSYQVLRPVRRVLIENGAAVGVELADGTRLRARAVVSTLGAGATFRDLLDPAYRPASAGTVSDGAASAALFAVHLALAAPPRYEGAPDALRVFLGADTPDEIDALWSEVQAGALPEPRGLLAATPTVLDPRQAPPGRHTAVLLQPAPVALDGAPERWDAVRDAYAERCLALWRQHARNLTDADILARCALTPHDLTARYPHLAPAAGHPPRALAAYRTSLAGLYVCGADTHPGPGWLGAAGHNAAQVVVADLGAAP